MVKLNQLHISGIRGFRPSDGDDVQKINFSSPLTLILGENGCGKTTIIEAINYACCGEVLGLKRDLQEFVSDPKLSDNDELSTTQGTIKLQIQDHNGNKLKLDKKIEVEYTPGTDQTKVKKKSSTLTILDQNSEEFSSTDTKVTKKLCQMLKVSPSVLNNVVFCHQENSTWPFLLDGQKLKEKFDEMFKLETYNAAVKKLQEIHQEKEVKIKVLKQRLAAVRDQKYDLDKKKRTFRAKEDKLEALEEQIKSINEQLTPLKNRLKEITDLKTILENAEQQLKVKEVTKARVIEEQLSIRKGMPPDAEFHGTDEELENEIKVFEMKRLEDENVIRNLEKEKTDVENKTEITTAHIEEMQTVLGALTQERNHYVEQCATRDELIEKMKEEMNVKTSSEGARNTIEELKNILESWQTDLGNWIEDTKDEDNRLQKTIDDLKETKLRTETSIVHKNELIEEHQKKITDISESLADLHLVELQLKDYTARIEQIDGMIASFNEREETQKLENFKKCVEEMEQSLKTKEGELKILERNDVIRRNIEQETSFREEKRDEIRKAVNKHYKSMRQLFGTETPARNVVGALLSLATEAETTVKNLKEKISQIQNDVTAEQMNCSHIFDRIQACEKQVKEKEEEILRICEGKTLNEAINLSFQNKEKWQQAKSHYESMKIILSEYIKQFEKGSCCPFCETNFRQSYDLVVTIITKLMKRLDDIPRQVAMVADELAKETNRYDQLQQLVAVNAENENLKTVTLPQLRVQLKKSQQTLDDNTKALESFKLQLQHPQQIIDICKNIMPDMAVLDQNQTYAEKSQKTIDSLTGKLVPYCGNKEQIQEQIDLLKSKLKEAKSQVSQQSKMIAEYKEKQQVSATSRNKLVNKQAGLIERVKDKSRLEKEKCELVSKIADLKKEIVQLRSKADQMKTQLEKEIQNKNEMVQINQKQVDEEQKKIATHKTALQDIEKLQNEIEDYLEGERDKKISMTEEILTDSKAVRDLLLRDKDDIIHQIVRKKEELATQALRYRSFEDNIILRDKIALEAKLESEIQSLKQQMAGNDLKNVQKEEDLVVSKHEDLDRQFNRLLGERNTLMDIVKDLRSDLDSPDNKRILKSYMSTYYELKVTENASYDLHKYIDALENAILHFHDAKLKEINQTLKELWTNIYSGNDIDYIEIKSALPANFAKKKCLIYKIVQVRNGREQDMRRRCSASQKLLASLIIRLALAESLGVNCGIFTIDEPTTNLDKEHHRRLCETLAKIVEVKQRQQKNFQLLVITHDEEFLNDLMKFHDIPRFYRVVRDDDGFSIIKEETVL